MPAIWMLHAVSEVITKLKRYLLHSCCDLVQHFEPKYEEEQGRAILCVLLGNLHDTTYWR